MGVFVFASWVGWIGAGVMALVCLFAFVKGDTIEKIGATALLMAWLLTTLIGQAFGDEEHGNWFLLLVDISLLATFAAIVWKAPRNWPIWACSLQMLIVASQVLILTGFTTPMLSYYRIVNMASLGILIAIAVGTFFAWQEKRAVETTRTKLGRYS